MGCRRPASCRLPPNELLKVASLNFAENIYDTKAGLHEGQGKRSKGRLLLDTTLQQQPVKGGGRAAGVERGRHAWADAIGREREANVVLHLL